MFRYLGSLVQEHDSNTKSLLIFMELAGGSSLHAIVNNFGPLSENIIQDYSRQIVEGLEFIHKQNIIHW